jgi:predicted lipoprotein with Yx(FWY)xxD motif
MTSYRVVSGAALLGVALLLSACGSSSSSSSTASAPTPAPASSSGSASAVSIGAVKGSAGMYLTGASGRALYLWVADSNGQSSCSGACATVWPPVIASTTPTAATGVNASDLATITRSDGTKQVTYKGHPLYYFAADSHSGMTKGQGSNSFGAKWWLVAPSGSAITSGSSSSTSSSGSSYSKGY